MATSKYFQNFNKKPTTESDLLDDVVAESIRIMGEDIWYIPRDDFSETDFLFGENTESRFERAYTFECYVGNTEKYDGGDFFSKFGLEMRNSGDFIVARKTFDQFAKTLTHPREGDLIYVPVQDKLFEIKYVNRNYFFYNMGQSKPYAYDLRVEQFRFSHELTDTGVAAIDSVLSDLIYTVEYTMVANGNYAIGETAFQGANLAHATANATVKAWSSGNGQLLLISVTGDFSNTANIKGASSNTSGRIVTANDLGIQVKDIYDNETVKNEGTGIIVPQGNPFGDI